MSVILELVVNSIVGITMIADASTLITNAHIPYSYIVTHVYSFVQRSEYWN
jgi:hypothetical protein